MKITKKVKTKKPIESKKPIFKIIVVRNVILEV